MSVEKPTRSKFTAKLEQWIVVYEPVELRNNPDLPPEMRKKCLKGVISSHPLILDDTVVITPPIIAVDGIRITVAGVSEQYDVLLGQPFQVDSSLSSQVHSDSDYESD